MILEIYGKGGLYLKLQVANVAVGLSPACRHNPVRAAAVRLVGLLAAQREFHH